jgi:hypothetical protein
LNQSLERIVFIGLNLALLVSTGIPLLLLTTQVISEATQQMEYQQFIDEVDEAVLFAEQNQASTMREISVPENITVTAQYNQLAFKFYLGSWFVITRSYEHNVTVEGPKAVGPHLLLISIEGEGIRVLFQPAEVVNSARLPCA